MILFDQLRYFFDVFFTKKDLEEDLLRIGLLFSPPKKIHQYVLCKWKEEWLPDACGV